MQSPFREFGGGPARLFSIRTSAGGAEVNDGCRGSAPDEQALARGDSAASSTRHAAPTAATSASRSVSSTTTGCFARARASRRSPPCRQAARQSRRATRTGRRHDTVHVEQVHDEDHRVAHHGARVLGQADRRRVHRVDRGREFRPQARSTSATPSPSAAPESCSPPRPGDLHEAVRCHGGPDLTPAAGAVRCAGEGPLVDQDVTGVARVRPDAADGLVVDDEPTHEAGAEVDEGEVPRRGLPRQEHLTDDRRGDVLLEQHGCPVASASAFAQRDVPPPGQKGGRAPRRASTSIGPGLAMPTPSTASTSTSASSMSRSTAVAMVRTTSEGRPRWCGSSWWTPRRSRQVEQHVRDDGRVDVHPDGRTGCPPRGGWMVRGLAASGDDRAGLRDHARSMRKRVTFETVCALRPVRDASSTRG